MTPFMIYDNCWIFLWVTPRSQKTFVKNHPNSLRNLTSQNSKSLIQPLFEPCRRLMASPLERSFHRRLFQRQSLLLGNTAPVQALPTITCRFRHFAPPRVVLYTKMSERSGQPLKKMVYILSILYFSGQILIKHSPTWNVTQSCTKYGKAKSELGHALGNSTSLTRCQQVSGVKK